MTMLRIVAQHFVAGIEVDGRSAPILAYMRGWSAQRIKDYCARERWAVETID